MSISDLSTPGCLDSIMNGIDVQHPILQILGTKHITGQEHERYRLLVSDGKFLNTFAMLATQLNELHTSGQLGQFAIFRVDRYITSLINKQEKGEKKVFIILELTILKSGAEVGKRLGEPVPWSVQISPLANEASPSVSTYTSKPVPERKPVPMNHNQSLLNSSINTAITHPIASLSPYQNKWVIKARVTSKSALRTWSNAKGEGKLFSMDLMDETGEIRATAFREQCDKYFDLIEVDKVYFISKCSLKPANKQYSALNNDYEMTFTMDTLVQPCDDESDTDIPSIKYNFIKISEIANFDPKTTVDVIGICKDTSDLQHFTGKQNNREFKKRELTLVDNSNASIQLTLWGDEAENFEGHVQPVILVKNARVTEFGGGKSVSFGNGSILKINPDIPEGHQLRGWFDNGGGETAPTNVSARVGGGGSFATEFLTFHEAKAQNLGAGDKPDYFQCKAVVHLIKTNNAYYKACAQDECNKKVVEDGMGNYRCEKCNITTPNFKYRLLIQMHIGDWTSSRWVTCFSEVGEKILGKTAEEIGAELDSNDESAAEKLFSSINFKTFIFKLRTKLDVYGDVHRNKITVLNAEPVKHKEFNKYLIKNLNQMLGIEKIKQEI